ncbi:hypothetical protein [Candidatus Chrysopegis kryptomonas]|jgi:hypothetical protein|uniref:Deoxyhypusine synthase n=1 Tax=Candidatus Chryseopegocella kryptomonas TaxID=1633643 RepID=A0A0P1NYS7_9BACT|nr:hypothetical protein [Candidatus Chrysopegis kryptomonas]CUT04975.1 hypothetical protein JGI23_01850 [Candidatus Chrysopegis kryptomonas]
MKSKYEKIDLTKVRTISIKNRKSKVNTAEFAKVFDPKTQSFIEFIDSLPEILVAKDLKILVDKIVNAYRKNKLVVFLIGAHVIKVGLAPLLIELGKMGVLKALAMNSATAIHDVETALFGQTSEDVAENIMDGSFGMAKETGDFINLTLEHYCKNSDLGYGEALGKQLNDVDAPNKDYSVLANFYNLNIPVTVHAAIGTDIVHQQPTMNGSVTGEMSFRDFKILCNVLTKLDDESVVVNVGSAVIMPEVFLKALTVVRNLGFNAFGFTTANFDMIRHYRPTVNVVQRPTQGGGQGFMITGHHEIMIPLLVAMIKSKI